MKKIYLILSLTLILRLLFIFYFVDLNEENYWEYGELAKNVINGNSYSLFYLNDSGLDYHFNKNIKPADSAYMPPGFVFFLIPFLLIKSIVLRNILIILVQACLSVYATYLIFLLSKKLFSEKIGLITAFITAITPELIYAVYSFTPTIIFHILIIILFLKLIKRENNYSSIILVGSIVVLIIYFRAEFILFALMLILYHIFRKEYKFSIIILLLLITLLSPWYIRNYITFNKFIPLTTSFGLNLYRGNNDSGIGEWGNEKIIEELKSMKGNPEIEMDRIFMKKAVDYVKSNPVNDLENAGIKLYYFLLFNPNDNRTTNLFYRISAVFYLIFFIYGIIKSYSIKKFSYFYIFFIYFTLVIIIFFPMIRYQAMMRILMIPFCAIGLVDFYNRSKNIMKFLHPGWLGN